MSSAPDGGIYNYQKSARWAEGMPDNIKEESDQDEGADVGKSRRKRKKGAQTFIVEEITGRDIQMASAYGGVAKPRIRKVGQRFANITRIDRTGLQTS